ncbi:MAG: hydantoinase/oxoprolinase family protein [Candidatus Hodarchaeota archaeon]
MSIDVGGTFTDLVALNEETSELTTVKIPSTISAPAEGIIKSLNAFLEERAGSKVSIVNHATTIAVNALLGQLGLELPRAALITTKGFRDVIEIGRQRRHELYNLFIQKPPVLIPRRLRYEVDERIGPKGEIIKPLNIKQTEPLIQLLKKERVDAVAISLLFSYINPLHEQQIGKVLRENLAQTYVSASSQVSPEHREYERTSTTVVNACLMPIISAYLRDLEKRIRELNVDAPLCIMQSDGGIASTTLAVEKPISIVESGPAAGVIASAFYGQVLGIDDILSFDMGGTTAKAGTVFQGIPEIVTEYEVAGRVNAGRIVKGSGYPVMHPFIDLAECSAGGGTIAWVDEAGGIQVGPISAGADPGPACYGKVGRKPTVTDANMVLGRLNPKYLLGGKMPIYAELSRKAIHKEICKKTRLTLTEAAVGIIRLVNSAMAKVLRIVSIERGYDPRQFTLMCFGGAGPMHGCALAEDMGIRKIVVPPNPGLFSAYGLLTADFKCNHIKVVMKLAEQVGTEKLERIFQQLEIEGRKVLKAQGIKPQNTYSVRQFDMRFLGQSYGLTIPTARYVDKEVFRQAIEGFHEKHAARYGYTASDDPVEVVYLRVITVGKVEKPKLDEKEPQKREPAKDSVLATRHVFFEQLNEYRETQVYLREKLKPGNVIAGPVIIEQYDSTIVVYPSWMLLVDAFENLILTTEKEVLDVIS